MGKDSPSAPAPIDYTGAAQAQGAANVDTARLQGKISNPNVYGPLGSQTVSWGAGSPVFNEQAYNSAMDRYNQGRQNWEQGTWDADNGVYVNQRNGGQYNTPLPTREQFTTTPLSDQATITQTLNPNAQATLDAQQRVQRALANLGEQGIGTASRVLGQGFNPNLPGIQTNLGNAGQIPQTPDLSRYGQAQGSLDTSNVAAMPVNAGMTGQQAIMARLAPTLARSDAATEQRLRNQGLVPGGEAYENAMISQNQQKNDLLSQAALQGIGLDTAANAQGFGQALQAGQYGNQALSQNQSTALQQQQAALAAQNQQYNQLLQGGQFGNTAQQQSLQQQLALRNQPLNEISGLMGGSQIQMPQFQGYQGANVAPAPIFAGAQAQNAANMQNYGIQQSGANAQTAGLYGLLGAGAGALGTMGSTAAGSAALASMFSDRRLKSNIERVGTHPLGIGVYEYDIFGKRQRGVMADEVETIMPEAVIEHPSGYKMVNYGALQ
tara:strand:+ start:294 stop:1775 length:1482 start_codon:yes stop_codon:yes gene_type:complete